MSDLCTYCGFTVDPACGACGSDPQDWDRSTARDAAIDAVRAWIHAGREGAKAAGTTPDMVNHPPHYTQGAVECIDAIHAALGDDGLVAYCRGNAIKYLWRTGQKGDAVQDMEKAVWYITKAVEVQRAEKS